MYEKLGDVVVNLCGLMDVCVICLEYDGIQIKLVVFEFIVGDIVFVKIGECLFVDGMFLLDFVYVDESVLIGEIKF